MCKNEVGQNGWTAMPADAGTIFGDRPYINEPGPLSIKEIEFPYNNPVVAKTLDYAKKTLHAETFNHSMRVYYDGMFFTLLLGNTSQLCVTNRI